MQDSTIRTNDRTITSGKWSAEENGIFLQIEEEDGRSFKVSQTRVARGRSAIWFSVCDSAGDYSSIGLILEEQAERDEVARMFRKIADRISPQEVSE